MTKITLFFEIVISVLLKCKHVIAENVYDSDCDSIH